MKGRLQEPYARYCCNIGSPDHGRIYNEEHKKWGCCTVPGSRNREFSMACSSLVGPEGLVIALEPNPQDFQSLISNIENNGIMNIVELNKAFSGDNRNVDLQFKSRNFSAQGFTINELHEILKMHNRDTINIIKMDIEGAEVLALRQLKSDLNYVRLVGIKLHDTEKEVNELLIPIGFKFRRLKPHQYLMSSIKFAVSHPFTAWRLWDLFTLSGERPRFSKIVGGIDISNSQGLKVGTYLRDKDIS